jgi:hypothetical protein
VASARIRDPSAWRRFRKPRRLTPDDRIKGPLAFYGVSAEQIAEWGCVSRKHALLIKAGRRVPSPQLVRLVCLHCDERVLVGSFVRFVVRGNKLVTPEGLAFLESELRGYRSLLDWAHSVAVRAGCVDEYYERLEACRELA